MLLQRVTIRHDAVVSVMRAYRRYADMETSFWYNTSVFDILLSNILYLVSAVDVADICSELSARTVECRHGLHVIFECVYSQVVAP